MDGEANYCDDDDAGSAPTTTLGSCALYRLTFTNNGAQALSNVVINDPLLGIINYSVGDLTVGASVVFDSGVIAELEAAGICGKPGTVPNIATADGVANRTSKVTDADPANVKCEAELGCWFTSGQNIQANWVQGRPEHSGGGNGCPSFPALPGDGGHGIHADHDQELHFQARSLTVIDCGKVQEIPPGAPSPAITAIFIRATASGIIKRVGGNSLPEPPATAVLTMEDGVNRGAMTNTRS